MKQNETRREHAKVFQAFCDENRLLILQELQTREQTASDLLETIPVVQSTLSHHMKVLCESGMVKARKDGKWTYYSLSAEDCANAMRWLSLYTSSEIPAEETAEEEKTEEPVRQQAMPTWLF